MTASQNGNQNSPGDEDMPIIYTSDDEGKQHCFQMIDELEVEGQQYVLLLYLGGGEDAAHEHGPGCTHNHEEEEGYEEELVIMRVSLEEGERVFESIDDDDEFERVLAYVEALQDDEEEDTEE